MHLFTKQNVDAAPVAAGVYYLYRYGELIYIGRAQGGTVTIRSRLQRHLQGYEGYCTMSAEYFGFEICTNPVKREVELLTWHRTYYGQLPACNERVG